MSPRPALSPVLALLLVAAAGCERDTTGPQVKAVIDDLAAQRFGTAMSRYRDAEDVVLSPPAAPEWRRGLQHEDATVRVWSVDAIARIGLPEDVPLVVAALDDPFRSVQEQAAGSIVEMDRQAALAAFLERLGSNDPLRQMISAQGLAQLADPAGVEPLVDRVQDPSLDDAVRNVIVQSLATLADPRAIAPLAALAGDSDTELQLRRNAVEALATFEQDEATEALVALVDSDDSYVREVARRVTAARR